MIKLTSKNKSVDLDYDDLEGLLCLIEDGENKEINRFEQCKNTEEELKEHEKEIQFLKQLYDKVSVIHRDCSHIRVYRGCSVANYITPEEWDIILNYLSDKSEELCIEYSKMTEGTYQIKKELFEAKRKLQLLINKLQKI